MLWLYKLLLLTAYCLSHLAAPFNSRIKRWLKTQGDQYRIFKEHCQIWSGKNILWIHAASYGEFEMAKPLIRSLHTRFPDLRFIASFFSPSGYERIQLDDAYFLKIYLPPDFYFLQKKYLKTSGACAFISIKYDFWYNLMSAMKHLGIPYYFVGLHLNASSYIFKWPFGKFKGLLKSATRLYVHNPESFGILENRGFRNIELFGDLRIQQVNYSKAHHVKAISWNREESDYIAYGSVSPLELPKIIECVKRLPQCNHLIALHDLESGDIQKIRDRLPESELFSESGVNPKRNVLILDTYGDLKYLYAGADLAYVGGAFEKGPHNILEAMGFGVPVIIGPNISKFPLERECHSLGLIDICPDLKNLPAFIEAGLKKRKPDFDEKIQRYFLERRANLDTILNEMEQLINA